MTRKQVKASILRALATTVLADRDSGADYMYEGVDEGDSKDFDRRNKMVDSLANEISAELERRADRLDRPGPGRPR